MRKLVVATLLTLDGVMEAPGGEPGHPHTGWAHPFMGTDEVAHKCAEALEAGSLLLGRITYESFAEGWSARSGVFADKMNAMPKHVVSTTLENPEWSPTTVIRGNVASAVTRLKSEDGGPILVAGSRTLVHTLMEHDLVDEYRLTIFPVFVGSGRRLFPDALRAKKATLRLASTLAFTSGVVVNTYRPSREG
ncbi:dihydrofolate reductase family protein [Pendulispora albinea]|uniref:Dihydrofolate reductase family protein n=1 Tax=Pendulispora albinea TaxID=2741071 RepID=A0ABZ2M530_9BACT